MDEETMKKLSYSGPILLGPEGGHRGRKIDGSQLRLVIILPVLGGYRG